MTNQEKKEWLSQYKRLNAKIDRLCAEESAWRDRATKVTSTSDGLPHGSGVSDKVGGAAAKIADLRAEINSEIDRLVELRREIEKAIAGVKCDPSRDLLRYHYIDGKNFYEIAATMHYSWRHIIRLHNLALSTMSCDNTN